MDKSMENYSLLDIVSYVAETLLAEAGIADAADRREAFEAYCRRQEYTPQDVQTWVSYIIGEAEYYHGAPWTLPQGRGQTLTHFTKGRGDIEVTYSRLMYLVKKVFEAGDDVSLRSRKLRLHYGRTAWGTWHAGNADNSELYIAQSRNALAILVEANGAALTYGREGMTIEI